MCSGYKYYIIHTTKKTVVTEEKQKRENKRKEKKELYKDSKKSYTNPYTDVYLLIGYFKAHQQQLLRVKHKSAIMVFPRFPRKHLRSIFW